MKTRSHGQQLPPLAWDDGIEVIERHGRRAELMFQAAEDGIEPEVLVAWADTQKEESHG